jgi:hypothetical protein
MLLSRSEQVGRGVRHNDSSTGGSAEIMRKWSVALNAIPFFVDPIKDICYLFVAPFGVSQSLFVSM